MKGGSTFNVGFASESITPASGLPLAGYGSRTAGATGVHDELEARALWVAQADETLALAAVDLVGVDDTFVASVRKRLVGLVDERQLIVTATHTHAGPAVRRNGVARAEHATVPGDVVEWIADRTAAAVRDAAAAAVPAALRWVGGHVHGVGANRRQPDGPFDDRLSLLLASAPDGRPRCALLHYACHPTVLDARNLQYSADYPGAARRQFEGLTGIPALFLNGAAGDISTRYTRRESSFAEVERMGALVAHEAARLTELPGPEEDDAGQIRVSRERIDLAARELPSPAAARRGVEDAVHALETARATSKSPAEVRSAETVLIGARRALALAESGLEADVSAELTAARLAGRAVLTVPGEPFTEVARRIAAEAHEDVLVVGYANGYVGYLVPGGETGGYEVGASVVGPTGVEALIAAGVRLVRDLRPGRPTGGGVGTISEAANDPT